MALTLTFCGGVQTVTGSMHLLTADRTRVLIDVGLFQGRRDEAFRINSEFPFEPSNIDSCIISHAHIDHCGNFPTLVRKGFRRDAYLTPSSRELVTYMLLDSGYIQEEDIRFVNNMHRKRGLPPRAPLYTQKDAERSLRYLKKVEYHHTQSIAQNIDLTFYDAGHILGSSIPVLDIRGRRGTTRLAYVVDLGRANLPYLGNPEVPKDIDYLIIESTYGARSHPSISQAEKKLQDAINKTIKRGGKIIIPSFALERTQEVLYFLARLLKKKKIREIPIFVDSPLAVNITEVFRNNWALFDQETRNFFKAEDDLFGYRNITYVKHVSDSKKLHALKGPLIIISASGMCENGRILHHLKHNVENRHNTIIIVGYMAENTLGRRIVERQPVVNIFGKPHRLNAEVVPINEFSAHADQQSLLEYIKACGPQLLQVFVVHGELTQSQILTDRVKSLGIRALIPAKQQEFYLAAR